jgi:uncharacterized caspase-like protein
MTLIRSDSEEYSGIEGEYYLLMIALDEYEKGFMPLNNAVFDAKNITQVLASKYQFKSQNLFLLLNEEATKKDIYNTFLNLKNTLRNEDSLLIYFIGHGDFNYQLQEGYWIPYDGEPREISSYISFSELKKFIDSLDNGHVLLISDSSFANSLLNF